MRGGTGSELLSTDLLWSECESIHSCLDADTTVNPSPGSSVSSGSFIESYVMGPRGEFLGEGGSHGARVEAWVSSFYGGTSLSTGGGFWL